MAGNNFTLKAMRESADAQVPPRLGVRIVAVFLAIELLLLLALALVFPGGARAEGELAEISVATSSGYARLVFTFATETEADVRLSNGIIVIAFKKPIEVNVERIAIGASGYVSAARRDPDGTGIRLALARKVTVNTMAAGEKLFVDLLPDGWTGLPPGLPQEVVEDLARRAREAEKKARAQQVVTQHRKLPPLRVRVGTQPTFTRYIFELPELIPVATERTRDHLMLSFEGPVRFDLADAQAALPPMIASIEAKPAEDRMAVRFALLGKVDVRSFREDNNYVVDVMTMAQASENALVPGTPADPSGLGAALLERAPAKVPLPAARPAAAPTAPAPTAEPPKAEPKAAEPEPAAASHDKPAEAAPGLAVYAPPPVKAAPEPGAPVVVDTRRQGDAVRLTFPFAQPTAAAVFRRADAIWLVFDTAVPIDATQIAAQSGRTIRSAQVTRSGEGQVVQLKLERPKLASVGSDGPAWSVTLGDMVLEPTRPVGLIRNISGPAKTNVVIPFDEPKQLHRLADPEIGDTLLVVTALGPARGLIKTQDFVEFRALATTHGLALQPLADDVAAELASDKVVIVRPGGLILSANGARTATVAGPAADETPRKPDYRPFVFDPQLWGFDRQMDFRERQKQLIRAAAEAPDARRMPARLELARFYLARDMYPEAKGVLDLAAGDERASDDASAFTLRAVANIMMRRSAEALKDLSHPSVGNQNDAPLWRALALAQQGKWAEAREGLKSLEAALATLPIELQRYAYCTAVRAAIEVRDFGDGAHLLNEFETLGIPRELQPAIEVLKGRNAEGLGRIAEALTAYRMAAESWDRPAAAQGRLRELALRNTLGELKRSEVIAGLEVLTAAWRGDETEIEALQLLGRFYTEEARYRDAFHVMRTAIAAHPSSDTTRRIQEEAATTFDALFLSGKGDALPAIDALSLFYDFRELTPIGRRGDEMIRRLADRLVSVDLLDQAAELLQHQVDHRLQGAARAQVAVRLAAVYLMARKPERAVQVLRTSRSGDLPNELRNQRLLLEARALSDTGRPDVALEVVGNIQGREVERLRADVLWKAQRWRAAAEQIEKLYGERWRDFAPLTEPERADVLRAAIGYALAEDRLGLDRFRQRYAPKMADGAERRAFEVVTTPFSASGAEFGDVARTVASADTLEAFLREIRARFPDTGAATPPAPAVQSPVQTAPPPQTSAPNPRAPS